MKCKKCYQPIPEDSKFCNYCGRKVGPPGNRKPKSRGNGQGSAYKLPNGKWRAAVTINYTEDGKRKYRTKSTFTTKKAALEYIPYLRSVREIEEYISFCDLFAEWSEKHFANLGQSKITHYKTAFNYSSTLHSKTLNEIKLKDLQDAIDCSPGGYYAKREMKSLYNLMFTYAIQNEYSSRNDSANIKLPPAPGKSKKFSFNRSEIKSLWTQYDNGDDFVGYILIMIYTGMRLGELFSIEKRNIFLDEGYMLGGVKTEAGRNRQIILGEKVRPIVSKLQKQDSDFLIKMTKAAFYKSYYKALERAKVRRLTPHSCRHTFASLLAETGVHPAVIKEAAGHESYQTTLQYTHISLQEKLRAIDSIGDM